MLVNFAAVFNIVSILATILGGFMLSALFFSFGDPPESQLAILYAAATCISIGALGWYFTKNASKKIGKREGYLVVSLGWFGISFCSALPYVFSGALPDMANAFFESVSGLTTTGASVMTDIEVMPRGILFWRSLTHWIGGMGIIVLTIAILPLLGIGGVELFVAESPGPTTDKIHPRIKETAKRLWYVYVGLTAILTVILMLEGMNFFDAINHSFATMATGGFSTKNASIAFYNSPLIEYTIAFFMFLAGANFTIIYFGLTGKFKKVWGSDEFKAYIIFVLAMMVLTTTMVYYYTEMPLEKSFRNATFMLLSLITTTGFITADYTSWAPVLTILFFGLLFIGGCAGSTAGSIKIIRHLVFFKNSFLEFKRLLHPRAMIRVKIDQQLVPGTVLTHILVFLLLYLIVFIVGSFVMSIILAEFEQPILTSIGGVATCLGNVGPGIGKLGPMDNFSAVPDSGKWVLSILMLLGRLELYTILILFTPYFWRMN
jgi:trk system potassium uptake protein